MEEVNGSDLGQDAEAVAQRDRLDPRRVDPVRYRAAGPAAILLPRLPTPGGGEAAYHSRSRILDEAENRMHAFKALLLHPTG
jgi:ornithine carbamoyltransferase